MYCRFSQPIWNEVERMKKRLDTLGFKEFKVQSDGNCQFRAIAHSLKNDEDQYQEIRYNVVSWLKNNGNYHVDEEKSARVSDFLETCQFSQWDNYCSYMGKDGSWGDHLTLFAAAQFYKIKISVISSVLGPDHQAETVITPLSFANDSLQKDFKILNSLPEYAIYRHGSFQRPKHIYLSHWHEKHYNSLISLKNTDILENETIPKNHEQRYQQKYFLQFNLDE